MAINKRNVVFAGVAVFLLVGIALGIALGVGLSKKKNGDEPQELPSQESSGPKLVGVSSTDNAVPNQWVVSFQPGTPISDVIQEIENANMPWGVNASFQQVNSLSMFCPDSVINDAISMPQMRRYAKYVERDRIINTTQQVWGLDRINQRNLPLDGSKFSATVPNGNGVNVYVLDTGIRSTHQDFGGRVVSANTQVNDGRGTSDCNGHGTHVAGSVGGNTYGVARGATLHAVRVLDCQGLGTTTSVMNGIEWVTANHVKPAIASLSLGGGASPTLDAAVRSSIQAGVTYVVAAGNDNMDACNSSPARVAEAITVGASTNTDTRASFSNYGSCVDIFAPGKDVVSTWYTADTATQTLSGTSMATPYVSGVVALYLEQFPSATPAQVAQSLSCSSSKGLLQSQSLGLNSPNQLLYAPLTDCSGGGSSSTTGAATTTGNGGGETTDIPYPTSTTGEGTISICDLNNCENETVYLGSWGAYQFHPQGSYFYYNGEESGVAPLRAWMVGPPNADFDLSLFKYVRNQWLKIAASETESSSEEISYSGSAGYYVWRVRSYDGTGTYTVAMLNNVL